MHNYLKTPLKTKQMIFRALHLQYRCFFNMNPFKICEIVHILVYGYVHIRYTQNIDVIYRDISPLFCLSYFALVLYGRN